MADGTVIKCPACLKKFKGKANLEGKKIKCPMCTTVFVVPGEKAAAPAPAAAAAKPAPAPAAPPAAPLSFAAEEEEDNKNPYGVTELDVAPRCPNCANLMADEKAFICLFCGYNTLTREIGKTEKTIAHTAGERFIYLLPGILVALTALGFIAGLTYFCVVLPDAVAGSWLRFLDHESMRMWLAIIALGIIWGCGTYSYKRLIIYPTPPSKKKDK